MSQFCHFWCQFLLYSLLYYSLTYFLHLKFCILLSPGLGPAPATIANRESHLLVLIQGYRDQNPGIARTKEVLAQKAWDIKSRGASLGSYLWFTFVNPLWFLSRFDLLYTPDLRLISRKCITAIALFVILRLVVEILQRRWFSFKSCSLKTIRAAFDKQEPKVNPNGERV